MKPGSPGFVGYKLKEAREARGISAISLADILGVSRQAVSQYEKGYQTPRPQIMERIAKVLNLPLAYFVDPAPEPAPMRVFYRSMSAATKASRVRAERKLSWLQRIVFYLRQFIDFPDLNYPSFDIGPDPHATTNREIEHIADQVRTFWGIGKGTISNLVWLLENNGTVVTRTEIGAETLDALSCWEYEAPAMFLGKDKFSAVRSRFDAAHELGHFILHRHMDRNRLYNQSEFRLIEDQAHRFAGAFLLPAETFLNDLYAPTLDSLLALKPKWNVSVALMIKRAEDLNYINESRARRLWINYARRRWKQREPLDEHLVPEQPRLLKKAFEVLFESKVQNNVQVLGKLPFAETDIEDLANLPAGFLSDNPLRTKVIEFTPKNSSRMGIDTTGDLLSFPEWDLEKGTD